MTLILGTTLVTPFLFALMIAAGEPPAAPSQAQPAPAESSDDEAEAQTPRLTGAQPAEAAPPPAPPSPPASGYLSTPMATLVTRPIVRPFEMPAYSPVAPMPYGAPVAPVAAKPVTVEHYRGGYEAPESATDQYYEQGVRSHFQAEQAMMGSLDGQWTVASTDGVPLLNVILNDPGGGAPLEGAWRDLMPGANGVDVLEAVTRNGASLILSYRREGATAPAILTLRPSTGGWTGELSDGAARQTVVMIRPAQTPQS